MTALASFSLERDRASLGGETSNQRTCHGQASILDRGGGGSAFWRMSAGVRAIVSVKRHSNSSCRTPPARRPTSSLVIVATTLSDDEGWKMVVENKPGAVMTIGATAVLKQPADGHTLLSVATPIAAVPALMPSASLNIETDFAPVIQIATSYNVLVVNPKVPVHSVPELIAYLKQDPGNHTFSSGGFGTPAHLIGELFKLETGVQATHVPYAQFPQAIADLLGGVNTYQFITVLPVVDLINSGQLRALAVMGRKRIRRSRTCRPSSKQVTRRSSPRTGRASWSTPGHRRP